MVRSTHALVNTTQIFFALVTLAFITSARAEEGMWLPGALPAAEMKAKHGFVATPAWVEHMQKSAVRISTGGSGSIVSADGLVMTNHHVGSDMLAKLSTPESDLLKTGFIAHTRAQELACPDLELNVLWEVVDVTDAVNAAATAAGGSVAEAGAARRQAISSIESTSDRESGLKSEVVTLYQGGKYHLYRYRRYSDVRLVFAPETAIAFFGGDADNFEFPRFDLDCCFFRIYENGKPLASNTHLTWSQAGAQAGELVFVWGHPGHTQRLYTADHVAHLRDVEEPRRLRRLWRSEVKLTTFMSRSAESARIAREDFFGVQNSRKAVQGLLDALQDPALVASMRAQEVALLAAVEGTPAQAQFTQGRMQVEESLRRSMDLVDDYMPLEGRFRAGTLASIARNVLRLSVELPKSSDTRLPEYSDASLESLYAELYSPAPIYNALEIEQLAWYFSDLAETRGLDNAMVQHMLAGKSPRARASELVLGTKLTDPAVRRALVAGGAAAIAAAHDPMLDFVASFDEESRAVRHAWEDSVESLQTKGYAEIAAARFAAFGDKVYPDATFTLRMSYGTIAGWKTETGETIAPFTTLGGTYERAALRAGDPSFELPQSWIDARAKLPLATPFNLVSTNDIIGGNSGSPMVNVKGEVVGLVFDGNLESLAGDVVYDITRNRTVAVDTRGMLEALRTVYDAKELVSELTAPKPVIP